MFFAGFSMSLLPQDEPSETGVNDVLSRMEAEFI
jgi:hypothetical protein